MADLTSFWEAFNDSSRLVEIECQPTNYGGLALDVLAEFKIPYSNGSRSIKGGTLDNIDIKRMDAKTVINMSLLQKSANTGNLYEAMIDDNGEVDFRAVGNYSGNVTDRYYTIQTAQYKEECTGVMVTGGKPRKKRKDVEMKPIWGPDLPDVYHTTNMTSHCTKDKFDQHATIVFNDPHLDSQFEDGIDNVIYEINQDNPYDQIIGYVYYFDIPESLKTDDTVVNLAQEARIPIMLEKDDDGYPKIGKLVPPPTYDENPLESPDCWAGGGDPVDFKNGVKIEIPDKFRFEAREVKDQNGTVLDSELIDKFKSVSAVYMIGIALDSMVSIPISNEAKIKEAPISDDYEILVYSSNVSRKIIRLKEGHDYAIAYEEIEGQPKQPHVVFANNARQNDPCLYGNKQKFKINPTNEDLYKIIGAAETTRTLFPINGASGLIVDEIHVVVELDTPSITVYDPDGSNQKAYDIAKNMKLLIGAMVLEDKPAPVGYTTGGTAVVIDQSQSIRDHDPTTIQDFEDTDYEKAMDQMQGNGLTAHFSFLDGGAAGGRNPDGAYEESETQVKTLSKALYDYMNSGIGEETVYVCGPNCDPQLGGIYVGGIVNEISYSYSDSSAYTVSVTVGSRLVGNLSQVDGGAYMKMTEDVNAEGTVIDDLGTHVHYKVQIDGFGERLAINTTPNIIRVGDKVSCTIHNCPIES